MNIIKYKFSINVNVSVQQNNTSTHQFSLYLSLTQWRQNLHEQSRFFNMYKSLHIHTRYSTYYQHLKKRTLTAETRFTKTQDSIKSLKTLKQCNLILFYQHPFTF